jgi:pre-rRNA-processing protein TSR3
MDSSSVPTTIIRHPREKLSKCSLTPLHDRPEMTFLRWKPEFEFDASGFTLLAVDAPALTVEDANRPLLILDSTWRRLPSMERSIVGAPVRRSIPAAVETAYPRVSRDGSDPVGGLASVEALFVARALIGDYDPSLLVGYYWAEAFLAGLTLDLSAVLPAQSTGGSSAP